MQTRLKHMQLSKIAFVILLGCFGFKSKAGIEPVLKKVRTGTAIGVDSILELKDYYSVNNKLDSFHLYRATNRLRLEINHDNISECLSSTFSICVRAQITKTDAAGDSTKDTVNLRVNYNILTGSFLTDAATYDFENSYETRVKILNIDSSAYRPFVKLTLEMEIERYRDIDMINEPTLDTISIDNTTGDLIVRWNTVLGAEEYDLEWLYQDNITATQGGTALTNIPIDFTDNGTGVTIKQNSYRISNIFDKGYFVCRVRAVTKAGHHFVHRIEGPWSNQDFDSNLLASGTNYELYKDYIEIEGSDVHEDSLNWQLITTFAEQGLKKEVITYMDGLFRGRQTVTRNNTDTMAIVGDFYYDHQNRQTIAVLPVPAFDKIIKYHTNFNKVKDKDTILRPRDYLVDESPCTLPNPRLDSTSGAGRYYSSANPLISNSGNKGYGTNQYIPHAFGYAYTKTEYLPDPTNRVRRQGGVGSTHQIGGGHETQYIYATAFEEELDPLFGNDIGFSEHYQKQMVIDPNGQVSVSYTNLAGKTVATALAGDNTLVTTALNSLDSNTVTYNLLSKNDSLYSDYALTSIREYTVEKKGYHYFDYKVNAGRVEHGCTDNLCYDCIYDLTISILDECGNEKMDGNQPLIVHIGKPLSELDVACEGGTVGFDFNTKTDDIPDSIAVYLPVGKYTIEKHLTVNLEAARMYADSMIKYDTCIKTREDYAKDILGDMDTWGCKINCETCISELGSLGHFMQKEKWRIYKDSGFTVLIGDSFYYKNVYQAKKDICAEMCTEYGACDGIWQMLYMDVSEGGQYGDDPAIKDSVNKHPEYCHYAHCIDEKYGRLYDAAMMSVSTYDEAEAAGYLNPLNNGAISYTTGTIDPYFRSTDGMGYGSKSAMTSYLNHVPESSGTPNGLSAWQIAVYATIGNHLTDSSQIRTFVNANPMGSADCSDVNDLMWLAFRAIYIQKKLLLYQANEQACDTVTIPEGKQRIFLNASQNKSFLSEGHDNDQDIFDDEMKDVCDSNCLYQVQNWLDEMGDCDFGSEAIKDTVIKALVKVCKYGCNDANPFGSSSVDRSKYSTAKYRTFGDVFKIWGIHVSGVCDTNLLQNLLPFNQTNHFMQNDTSCCNCDFDTCTNNMKNAKYKKLIKYTLKQKRDTACRECKTCDEIGIGVQAFNKVYPNIAVYQNHHFPELFQKYMNQFFRFNLSYQEYMDFMEECLGVKDSVYNDSIIYKQYLSTYYPYSLIKPTGYASLELNKIRQKEPLIQKQPKWQYASINANGTGLIPTSEKISSCHCEKIFQAIKDLSIYPASGEYDQSDINTIMGSISGCVFNNPSFVFKTCLAAAQRDTGFYLPDFVTPMTWSDDQQGYLDDEILEDEGRDSLNLDDASSNCDCIPVDPPDEDNWNGSWGNSSHTSSGGIEPCDSVEWWVNMYLDRSGLGRRITMADIMEMSWHEKKKLSKYLDSIYIRKGYMTGVVYDTMNFMDSNAVQFHLFRLLDQYFRCIEKPQENGKPQREGCGNCYQDGKNANLLLNYLRQMTGRNKYSNYLTMNAMRLVPPAIKSYYETDLYKYGTHPNKLTHGRVSSPYMTHYREFQVVDDNGHNFYLYLAFLDPQKKYNFGSLLSFFDLQVIKDSCSSKSTSFIVKAILKGTYPKLDTTLLYGAVDFINLLDPCTPKLCNRQINEINFKPDSCMKSYHNLAEHYAALIHDRYIDSLKQDFYNQYIAKCKHHARLTEEFTVTFKRSVYHYTLYYYDQLGNLIQTVPPAGVVLLTGTALDSVKAARELPNRTPYYPSHTLITRYKYNTLNQLVWQSTPDAGASNFWYDRLGRLVSSQNAQQYSTTSAMPNKRYSYTLYDSLGRIKEVGELTNTTAMSTTLAYDYNGFVTWVGSGGRTQITRTYYDRVKYGEGRTGLNQENLRSRVASITVQQAEDTAYDEAVHYSYDIHGNVKSMVRENKQLIAFAHHLKKMEYDYDLISGKVNKVIYQKNKADQFIHSYTYDAENRIQTANTSTDNVHYEADARYTYYKHGPLARTEIGRLYVQGVDYIYTLQGWLKGVNNTTLSTTRDPNKDGYTSGANMYVARDEYGFSLRYFKNDYKPINLGIYEDTGYFDIKQTGKSFADASPELFNGNISNMVTGIRQLTEPTLGRAFKYDQLNRIKEAFSFTNPDSTNNQWGASQASDSSWYESFSYDANGNITKLKRKGNNSSHYMMDNFAYNYQSGTNKLTSVDDQVTATNYTIDIDDQSSNNYKYDLIGNLTIDVAEGIDSIQWNVYGKIKSITRTDPFYEDSLKANLNFTYTPDGHRSTKGVSIYQQETEYTYYVRDAQGNVMATYEMNNGKLLDSSQLTKANINTQLISTTTVQTFADFMIDEMEMDEWLGLVSAYRSHVVSSGKTEDVLLGFNPVPFIVYNTAIQTNVLAYYTPTTILQSISNYQIFSTFYANIMPTVCTDAQIVSLFEGFIGMNTLLANWNPMTVVGMGNAYRTWCIGMAYPVTPLPCVTLGDVQTLAGMQTAGVFSTYISGATTYHTALKTAIDNAMTDSDIIQQMAGGVNIRTIINSVFSTTVIFSALRDNGLATLWGYIIDETAPVTDALDYYKTYDSTEFVKQCIIVLPSFIDSYLPGTVSAYLQHIRNYYTTEQYAELIAALTELYFTPTQTLQLAEWHIYGSSRVGIYRANKPLAIVVDSTITAYSYDTKIKYRYNGKKQYELTNHLGNVLVTISDRRTAICNDGDSTLRYKAVVITAQDYYCFGSSLIGRTYYRDSSLKYRYGFNNMEHDLESKTIDFGERMFNSDLGRFLSVDPDDEEYAWQSTYAYCGNSPIFLVDYDGEGNPIWSFCKGIIGGAKSTFTGTYQLISNPRQTYSALKYAVTHPGAVVNALKEEGVKLYRMAKKGDIDGLAEAAGNFIGSSIAGVGISGATMKGLSIVVKTSNKYLSKITKLSAALRKANNTPKSILEPITIKPKKIESIVPEGYSGKVEKHHITSQRLKDHPAIEDATKGGFKINGKGDNIVEVPKYMDSQGKDVFHAKHTRLTTQETKFLDEIYAKPEWNNLSSAAKADYIRSVNNFYVGELVKGLSKGTKMNNIIIDFSKAPKL